MMVQLIIRLRFVMLTISMYLIYRRILVLEGLYKPAISTLKNMDITSTFRWMAMDSMILVLFPVWLSRLKLAMTWLSGLGFSSELGGFSLRFYAEWVFHGLLG